MTYGYIRVSTDKQTVENQRFEISRFCEKQNLLVDGWIEETISGQKVIKVFNHEDECMQEFETLNEE